MLARHFLLNRYNASRHTQAAFLRHSSTLLKSQLNQPIVDLLLKHRAIEKSKPNSSFFRVQAFDNAIYAVEQLEFPIRSVNDIIKVQGIGPGITARINEYFLADEALPEMEPTIYQEMLKNRTIKEMSTIPGIGPTTAKKLVEAGCTTLQDLMLERFSSMLSVKQLAKIKYAGRPAPVQRQDAQDVLAFCCDSLDSQYEVTLVGDYRRGIMTFPEIRLMVTHPDYVHVPLPAIPSPEENIPSTKRPRGRRKNDVNPNLLHTAVIPLLQQRGLIAEAFSNDYRTWEGMVRLPGPQGEWGSRSDRMVAINNVEGQYRKMKIHIVPQKSRGASLICLTGDSDFEKDICYRARQRNMLFNEYGLWKWASTPSEATPISTSTSTSTSTPTNTEPNGAQDESHGFWSLIMSSTEEDVFKELGMDPIDPTRRNFSYITSKQRKKRTTIPAYHQLFS